MSTLNDSIRSIEEELHTLETATPRNSATVDRGGLSVVDEGSVIVEAGGTVFFDEGGAAASGNFSIIDKTGWQIGTERRGTSILVFNDAPGESLEVTTADSSADYEEVQLVPGEDSTISLGEASTMYVHLFHTSESLGNVTINGEILRASEVFKSQKTQWVYSYMRCSAEDVVVSTDMEEVQVRVLRLSVNNAA